MTPSDREPTGQRIARAKRRRGLSQAVLAGLVGRSESWLSQVERGKHPLLSSIITVSLQKSCGCRWVMNRTTHVSAISGSLLWT